LQPHGGDRCAALGAALKAGAPLSLHHQLCRKDAGAFQAALGQADDIVVGCTQEAPLFGELAADASTKVRFVNLREHAGWSPEAKAATPKWRRSSRWPRCPIRSPRRQFSSSPAASF
jgi:hypothetical protein